MKSKFTKQDLTEMIRQVIKESGNDRAKKATRLKLDIGNSIEGLTDTYFKQINDIGKLNNFKYHLKEEIFDLLNDYGLNI